MEKYRRIEEVPIENIDDFDVVMRHGYIFEKMDGGNTQVDIIQTNGSKDIQYSTRKAKPECHSRAPWFSKFQRFVDENYAKLYGLDPATYYLEFLAPHTVRYKKKYVNRPFLIDVMVDGRYIDYKDAVDMVKDSGKIIETLPIIHEGEITGRDVKRILLDDSSPFSKNGEREGLVLKNYDTGLFLKVLNPKVLERRK